MRTSINLSRQPFTNHRIFWIALTAVYLTSFWLLLWITNEKGRVIASETNTKQLIAGQKQAADDAKRERERRTTEDAKIVVTEQQAIQLAAARQLIERKGFSWNRMIADLEEYVPKNTRILSIKMDEFAGSGAAVVASIQVKAVGTTPAEMTEMMANLLKSDGSFTTGEANQDPTAESGETPFTLQLTYTPTRGDAK